LEQQFREVTIAAQAGDAELKQIDKTVGDNFRNVGNYEGATKGLKQQLREMTVALQNMESTDPRFKQMTIDAGELKDKIMDTNAVIKSTAGSAVENLGTGIAKAGKVGIDAFAGMTGAMGLFGIESEGAMQAMLKLQQLAAMSEALTSLGALGDTMTEIQASFSAAVTKLGLFTSAKVVDTTVTEVQTVATEGATIATNFLGKAMSALPIIGIVAGLAALAVGMYSYVKSTDNLTQKQKDLNSTFSNYRDAAKQAITVTQEVKVAFDLARQGTISKKEALQTYNETLGDTFGRATNLNDAEKLYNEKTAAYIKSTALRAQAQALLGLAAEEQAKALVSGMEDQRTIAEEGAGIVTDFIAGVIDYSTAGMTTLTKDADKAQAEMYENAQKRTKKTAEQRAGAYTQLAEDLIKQATALEKESSITIKHDEIIKKTIITKKKESKIIETNIQLLERENKARESLFNTAELERILLLDEERAVLSSDIAITEGEIALAKANQSGNTKDIVKAEEDLRKLKEDQIKAQLKLDLAKTDDVNKRTQLEKQAELDIINLGNGKIEGAEKASLDKRLKTQEEFIKMTTDFFIKNSEKKIAQMDKEIAKAESQYTLLQQLAANGNINAQESLAEQQRIINEANARKEKEMKRQQRIKLVESVYSTYNSKVAGGSEHPLMDTIKDTMLLQQFIASLPTFFDGTENTGKNGNGIDGKGGFHAVLHPNERVIPKSLNEQIGGLSNEALAKMASEYQNGKIIRSNSQIGSAFDTAILVGKLDELTSAIKQKPETNIGIGEITQSVMEIVKSTKQGNTTTYNRYKVRR
jgi:hypothetical protein